MIHAEDDGWIMGKATAVQMAADGQVITACGRVVGIRGFTVPLHDLELVSCRWCREALAKRAIDKLCHRGKAQRSQ